jgi:superfamily II RNA helicase
MEDNLLFKEGEELSIKEVIERSFNKGFQAGQLAEREKCLKMIEELKKRFEKRYYGWGDLPIWRKEFKELTQKINEVEKK